MHTSGLCLLTCTCEVAVCRVKTWAWKSFILSHHFTSGLHHACKMDLWKTNPNPTCMHLFHKKRDTIWGEPEHSQIAHTRDPWQYNDTQCDLIRLCIIWTWSDFDPQSQVDLRRPLICTPIMCEVNVLVRLSVSESYNCGMQPPNSKVGHCLMIRGALSLKHTDPFITPILFRPLQFPLLSLLWIGLWGITTAHTVCRST